MIDGRSRASAGASLAAPSLAATGGLLTLGLVLDHGRAAGLPLSLVNAAGVAYFAILVAAPLVLYPILLGRGARPLQRIVLSLLPVLVWWLGEVAFRARLHSLPAAVYLASSPLNLLHFELLALELLLADAGCRLWRRRRGVPTCSGRTAWMLRGLVLASLALTIAFAVPLFLGYQATYRTLFERAGATARENDPGSAAPAPASATLAPAAAAPLPNIVVILSDDHRWDAAGHAGHPFIETPALDRLAAEGVRFRNAFVTTSLCSPSRASFLTGQLPERHGVIDNFTPWNGASRTFFEPLAQAGYRTAFIGKWHMPGPLPALRGVDELVTFTVDGGQGRYLDCPLRVNGREEASRKRYVTEELTDRALAFVEAHRDEPFALYLSHKSVHAPFTPDAADVGRYASAPFALPPGAAHGWAGMTGGQYVHLQAAPLGHSARQYAEAVRSLDRQIGRVLDGLDAWNLSQRTLVVYASDNGYLWGEHGLVDKRWAYEESIRIPFLLRYPPLTGAGAVALDPLVLNVDLAPTLLELAGIPVPAEMQGRSLLALLRDARAPWREAFVYRYFFEAPYPVPAQVAVRTLRHKLVRFERGGTALFDLERDPHELHDLARADAAPAWAAALEALLPRTPARLGPAPDTRTP